MAYKTTTFDDEIVRRLERGGVGLLPSDTIYGLSGRALDEAAAGKIRKIKGRDSGKPFIVLISDLKMLDLLSIPAGQAEPVKKYWPAPLSVVFDAPEAPDWLRAADGTLAVRLPDFPELLELIDKTCPLISTSANLQGQAPALNVAEAKELFGDNLDFYVDAGELDIPPSTLAKIENGKLKVIRQGSIKIDT